MKIVDTIFIGITIVCLTSADVTTGQTTVDVLRGIYYRCSNDESMLSCSKPKILRYLSAAAEQDRLPITQDLSIVRSRRMPEDSDIENYYETQSSVDPIRKEQLRSLMLEKLDSYLSSHILEAKLPEEIVSSDIVPRSLIESVPKTISIPLSDSPNGNGRGFVKKVMIPFLLGLKFKATALVPLALALIALKTWKALTLGLLSLVLSGAMLIFKLTKPKVAYEVLHYGHPPVEHPPHWDTAPHGPYRAYKK
ncbi:PREDICTED: uncharacterized protein LOC105367967 [Ceratosolen solmsi marchali]|uniref:Uncharacterized protein LOC105367967 n=1 Tax=Ceratosolen solmsi marchali TaxID=326594 RepID=A0AAJ6YVJ1_9HYME|nr:PREDICTED: uncharacterized protein LOC105367967 [Ceratosolen solmsi marchali]